MAKRQYNADTNKWEEKAPKTKPTPASNTRKKMKKAAEAEKKKPTSAPKPAKKAAPKKEKKVAPIPRDRPKKKEPVKGLRLPKAPSPRSDVGKMPSQSDMEKATGVKMKPKKKFLRGTMMTGSMRKGK